MHLAYTASQEALRADLRSYFADLMTDDISERLESRDGEYGVAYREVVRRLGDDGWLALGWPVEYGGGGRSTLDQLIFMDEAATAGCPVPFLTINTVGPTIMRFGTPAQKDHYLPRIAAGEIHFSIGYSEPEAGTDLASLRTSAVLDGDEFVINGQKMWTSLIQHADYVWLACRTNKNVPKHKGLSIIIVPTTSPGFSWTPVRTVAGTTTSATYYQDVRVPAGNLVGGLDGGWPLITNQLNHERVALTSSAPIRLALAEVTGWAHRTGAIEKEWVRLHLARVHAKVEFLKLINWKVACSELDRTLASATKVFGTEFAIEAYRLLMEVLGDEARGSRVERMHRSALILTFGGGTNEVQRDIIAAAGLGLPAARR